MKVAETTVSKAFLTSVPASVRNALNLNAGDTIEWHIENDEMKIRKKLDGGKN